jgi:eukaryotic-like serine/threonine-protein kinase
MATQNQQQRYRVIERIAAGGMAEVFRAESAGLEGFKKKVAIKRVLPHLTEKAQFINMFLDEARLSAHLGHSNCVQVFDIGKGDSAYFIVMEYVDGADLKAIIEYQRANSQLFPVEEACLVSVRICEGLTYAHELRDENNRPLGIVHRDMSPPNVLITRYGEVKIADFGLAKANSQLEESQPGVIKGKFGYLSPEAALGRPVDLRTDIYAVGIMLWEMLSGRRLFQGATDLDTVRQVQRGDVPDLRQFNPHVPDTVLRVLGKALAPNPDNRYQTARALGDDLNRVLFELRRAVSSFDIARLVTPIQAAKASEKQRKATQQTFIGSLIDEALIEFTSLNSGGNSEPSLKSATIHSLVAPLPQVAGQGVDWGDSLGLSAPPPEPKSGERTPVAELGNLSALEDERTSPKAHRPSSPSPQGTSPIVWAVVIVTTLLVATGGAYLGGFLPPQVTKALHLPRR